MKIADMITHDAKIRDEKFEKMAKEYFSKKMKTVASRKKFFDSIGAKTDKNGKLII